MGALSVQSRITSYGARIESALDESRAVGHTSILTRGFRAAMARAAETAFGLPIVLSV